jgi:hypothetical protein
MELSKQVVSSIRGCCLPVACTLLATLLIGCGQKSIYPVHGQLVDPEGKPITGLKGGTVEFEALDAQASANGPIEEDGTFRLTTEKRGDGAHLGKHRVAITRPYVDPEHRVPPVIDPRYENPGTSGLEVLVEPKNNEIRLTVERLKKR